MMPQIHICARPRPKALELSEHSRRIVGEILAGTRSHKDLKVAFDWEATPEGHMFWSKARQAPGLSDHARDKLRRAADRPAFTPTY